MGSQENREVVEAAFEAWAQGTGSVFDLLADDCTWTITGSSSVAGTYGPEALREQVLVPLAARLSIQIQPTLRTTTAEGDRVVVLWDAAATALDGEPYENTYSWHLTMEGGRVVDVVAFFDTKHLDELLARVDPT